MSGRFGWARKSVAAAIMLLTLSLSVAVPLLERLDIVGGPIAESEHNPATCPPAHDHTICTQFGANLSAPAPAQPYRLTYIDVRIGAPSTATPAQRAAVKQGNRSRAPPLA